MTPQFETMLRLFADGATGKQNTNPGGIDADAVVSLAHSQGVWTVVYPALSKVCDSSKYHIHFLKAVSDSIRRNEFTLKVLGNIMAQGIDVCLLKGVVTASLYENPECRISSDTDILIKPKDEKRIAEILKDNGYTLKKRKKNDHHMKAVHPVGGLLEVHISLYSKITEKILFNDADMCGEEWIEFEYDGKKMMTLGINDNLNYLTAHYIKHFVTGGASIRQMMDLLLYIKKFENEIDFEKYDKLLKTLKYDKLINSVKTIGAMYFGMDFEVTDADMANALLDDCVSVGLFGVSSHGKGCVYHDYCKSRKSVSSAKLRFLFWFKDEQSIFGRMFPAKKVLMGRGYSYAKHSLLVPAAWIHNLFDALCRRAKPVADSGENAEFKSRRTKLMKNLDMIE